MISRRPTSDNPDQLSDFQELLLAATAEWSDQFDCIERLIIWGSVARGEHTSRSDIDFAFEYATTVQTDSGIDCYTRVNSAWCDWAEQIKAQFGIQPKCTGLSPFAEPYDAEAWKWIKEGKVIARRRKATLIWTQPKAVS